MSPLEGARVATPRVPPRPISARVALISAICAVKGSTVAMRAALQCLSNSPALCRYFASGLYRKEVNLTNPIGYEGKMAFRFGELMSRVWNSDAASGADRTEQSAAGRWAVAPRALKDALGHANDTFSGNQQHDAQELLAFLMDALHEDLNRVKDKPAVEDPDSDGRSDEEIQLDPTTPVEKLKEIKARQGLAG